MKGKIYLYDTTLRDGAQTEGISYSLKDKIRIAKKLDEFGIQFIEGGWPYSSPKEKEFFDYFKKHKLKKAKLVSFGSTIYPKTSAQKDKNLLSLLRAETEYVTIFGKTWDLHIKEILKTSLDENLRMIYESVNFLKKKKRIVFYDAEHFFDGYKSNPEYSLKTLKVAEEAGVDVLILCDTNGGTLTSELREIIREVKDKVSVYLGIHTHNDCGLAVANSITAIEEGCSQIQGTFNGYGERCGNADLTIIIPILKLKLNIDVISEENLKKLTEVSHFISEVSNTKHMDNHPFVGRSAFAHKGGVHINAVVKNPKAYEHIEPKLVGNQRRLLVSELSGKTSIVVAAKELSYELEKKSPKAKKIHRLLQKLEKEGFQFEAADASFKLILEREFKRYKKFFQLLGFRVIIEKRENGNLISEATIKLKVQGKLRYTVSEGNGPVNALDNALREALLKFYPELSSMHLSDFKVRVLDEEKGTAAKVRVLIESQDEEESWTTIGVSENIIEASWAALVDSVEYKLLKETKKNK
ncbi:MAG: citramalate synthase [Candidatus Omnitrophota bacterium]|nr:MAG: citramalate synthase [Candidatus Omnitrophota bacterium]